MASIDVFSDDAFGLFELTGALERIPFQPSLLGQLNIFTPKPISTTSFAIENRGGTLNLINTTPRGAPLPQASPGPRDLRYFGTVRLAKGDRLNASEIQNLRAFGSETEFAQVQAETLTRMAKLRADLDLTLEYHRLGALQGIVLDANGDVLFNWFDEWGIAQPAEIDFNLDAATTDVRGMLRDVKRSMQRAARGGWTPGTSVGALAGDAFFDALINHPQIKETKLNTDAGAPLLENIQGYSSIEIEGITFINYRGADDLDEIAIDTDKVKFFPMGGRDLFQHVMAPGETFDVVNTPGRPFYALTIPDRDRNAFVGLEIYSYPALVATRPQMLLRGKRT
ncbi:major capsid protein [Pseudoxanthomonas winnipegensis]|uniref:Major capsid protein n=1 Tax=Pseudoxanthomonas winnipegensis TaxID=2480810 RepID=A0A4Q8M7W6_9GAMM|nr:major capsid protein [Pseudoxanthomonas winnipegensis]TAA45652.1 major capsid protein [Pseudoxanthomonas winnipegensis]